MNFYSMKSQADIIRFMLSLINQLIIKFSEQESIAEVFFQFIWKTNIYFASIFMKINSTMRLSFND